MASAKVNKLKQKLMDRKFAAKKPTTGLSQFKNMASMMKKKMPMMGSDMSGKGGCKTK